MRVLRNWLLWWLAFFGLWLVYVGVLAPTESAFGAAAAAVAATAAELVRSRGLTRLGPDASLAHRALRMPFDVVVQFWLVTRLLGAGERPHGRLRTVPFRGGALSAWAETISPRNYVLEVEDDEAVEHILR